MSDNENNTGSPIDRSKRPRFEDEEWDSDQERDGHDDRHPKRLAVSDPETKAPHFVPTEAVAENKTSRRNKWEEKDESEDEQDIKPHASDAANSAASDIVNKSDYNKEDNSNENNISMRSLVGTKDAGVIIGRGGKNVSDIRELSSARVTISEIVPGAYERILTVSGPVPAVAKAYALVGEKILNEHTQPEESNADGEQTLSIRLLVPDNKMGVLIGKGGSVIKSIQDDSGARLNASEEPLPLSTERTIAIQGTPDAIRQAVQLIGKILIEFPERISAGFVQYRPIANVNTNTNSRHYHNNNNSSNGGGYMRNNNNNNNNNLMNYPMMPMAGMPMNNAAAAAAAAAAASQFYYHQNGAANPSYNNRDYQSMMMNNMVGMTGMVASSQAQQIFIPNEMVGCIIGKGGSKINEIRHLSGSHIKIADSQGDANERLVTITGTPESNQMALYLLYSRLESEKNRLTMRS